MHLTFKNLTSALLMLSLSIPALSEAQSRPQDRRPTPRGGGQPRQAEPRREQPRREEPRQDRAVPRQEPRREQPRREEPRREQPRQDDARRRQEPPRRDDSRRNDNRAVSRRHDIPDQYKRGDRIYTQRVTERNNRVYVERSRYRSRGNVRVEVKRNYVYRNWNQRPIYVYTPVRTYRSTFWFNYHRPFTGHVTYRWGFATEPWYINFGFYYPVYTYYPAPSYYVTDYVYADIWQDAYEEGYLRGQNEQLRVQISQLQKEQLRKQVDTMASALEQERSLDLEEAFRDSNYLFTVDENMSVLPINGSSPCSLTPADLLAVGQRAYDSDDTAVMVVALSKGSCQAGTRIRVSVKDLQEMLNTVAEKVEDGLQDYETNQSRFN